MSKDKNKVRFIRIQKKHDLLNYNYSNKLPNYLRNKDKEKYNLIVKS